MKKENREDLKSNFASSTMSSLNDEFKRALGELENKFGEFEQSVNRLGKQGALGQLNQLASVKSSLGLGSTASSSSSNSYTLSLIKMVSSLLDYLRETISELSYEKIKQNELNKQLDIHRKLIDGLTTEIIIVKEQNQKILSDYVCQSAKTEAELDQIKVQIRAKL